MNERKETIIEKQSTTEIINSHSNLSEAASVNISTNTNNPHVSSSDFAVNPISESSPLLTDQNRFAVASSSYASTALPDWMKKLNWQQQDLISGQIDIKTLHDINDPRFPASWVRWLIREPFFFKILLWMLLPSSKKKDSGALIAEGAINTSSLEITKKWPGLSTLPFTSERALRTTYGLTGFIRGVDLIIGQVWSSISVAFLGLDLYNYYSYPDERYGTTLGDILLGQAQNQKAVSQLLTDNRIWPGLLGLPLVWGLARALLGRHYEKQLSEKQIEELKDTLGRYEAGLGKDIIRWILPSLIPEFIPILGFCALLPEPKLKHALETTERLLLWDGRISPEIRHKLVEALLQLADKAPYVTRLQVMSTLAKIVDGVACSDLPHLSEAGMSKENLDYV